MKAVLFSNFPKDVFDNTLKPKFDQHGVEILRLVKIDISPNVDVSKADVVIAMVELMSSGQREKVKKIAKTAGKRYIGLSRKGGDWARDLGLEPTTQTVARAIGSPALSLVPSPPPSSGSPFVPMPPPPMVGDREEEEQSDEQALEAAQELLDEAEQQIAQLTQEKAQAIAERESQKRANVALAAEKGRSQKALAVVQEELDIAKSVVPKMNQEIEQLNAQVRKLSEDLGTARREADAAKLKPSVHSLDNLFKSIEALKVLVRAGLMDPNEAFEKLANFKPKG